MRAIISIGNGQAALVHDRPSPVVKRGYIKVKVKAVALNPSDWKSLAKTNAPGFLLGYDYAGIVQELGTGYSKDWRVGDRIAGFAHGLNVYDKNDGTFAEEILVKADVQLRIPQAMTYEEAATLGVGIITCGQGLVQQLGLRGPDEAPSADKQIVLIYGGSTATGTLAIQFASHAGYKVIAVTSTKHSELARSRGAEAVFDYKNPTCHEQIRSYTSGSLKFAWDTVSTQDTAEFCAKVLGSGARYGSVLPVKMPRSDVQTSSSLAYTAFGEPIDKPFAKVEGKIEDFDFARRWATITERLLEDGKLITHNPASSLDGLSGVITGLKALQNGKVSGQKLVYMID